MNKFTKQAVSANNKIKVDTIQLDPRELDAAITGIRRRGKKTHLVYSYTELVRCFMKMDSMEYEEAVEWVEYNTLRAIPYMAGLQLAEPIVKLD